MNILIVDDSQLNLRAAKDVIMESKIKCTIVTSTSGQEAIDIIETKNIDIVLLDIIMPQMSGIEVLKELKKRNKLKELVVLMFTSLVDKQYLKVSFELGASDFINKPIEPIEFVSRLKSAIRLKEYQKSLIESYNELKKNNVTLRNVNIQLQKTQLELIHKEKLSAIGRFAAAIAHEINTPLGYIGSNFTTLKKYNMNIRKVMEKYRMFLKNNEKLFLHSKEALQEINTISIEEQHCNLGFILSDSEELLSETSTGISKIAQIISSLVKFTDINTENELRLNNFNEIVKESLQIINSELAVERVEDIANLNLDLISEDQIICDRVQLQQVIINSIQNSLYFIRMQNPIEKGYLTIRTYKEDAYFCCDITDDGTGITEDAISKIFEPFFTTKDIGEGIGLGLTISYDIVVNKHKGEISVRNNSNSGCTFSIKLPGNLEY